ncbi:MFS transporter [Rhizocola hellebori]|uniref:MFS transporter n=1 Tax=Rhizocola hellebori TaxID=1392758 RepID=A0A8J3QD18_9ACTN|nr:MFS transporter [Rhizocola hellebori]GIH08415.1 MFS transporter [Rhizocola hellebori]
MLAVTQTVGYGVLFYAFAVLLAPMAAELKASTATITGAFTVSILTSAAAAIPIGRWLDRHGGRLLMTCGSVTATGAVLAWSRATSVAQVYAVFVLIGLASAMVLYETAFPVIVAASAGAKRDSAILAVTMVAGLAGTAFLPLIGVLLERYGWRTALVILAALLAIITIPAHFFAVPGKRQHTARKTSQHGAGVGQALRDKGFWLLTIAFVLHGAAVYSVGVHLVGFLRHAGHTTTVAATLAGLLGLLSVTGRLATTGFARRRSMGTVTAFVLLIQATGAAALTRLSHSVAGAAACIIAFGLGFGVSTIARPAIVADRYGTVRYATIAAAMAFPITLVKAIAPLAAATVSPTAFMASTATACLLAALLLFATSRHPAAAPAPDERGSSVITARVGTQ